MNKELFDYTIGSDLDYEDLIADIGYKGELVAILTQEEGFENMKIKLFPRSNGEAWEFSLKDFEEVIIEAKKRLWELRRIPDE